MQFIDSASDFISFRANNFEHMYVLFLTQQSHKLVTTAENTQKILTALSVANVQVLALNFEKNQELLNAQCKNGEVYISDAGLSFYHKIVHTNPIQIAQESIEFLPQFQQIFEANTQQAKTIIDQLINSRKIFVFMQGSPLEPKCGFSRRALEPLLGQDKEFGFFDALSNFNVLVYLRKFFGYPSIPQVFVNGKLIGGSDKILEFAKSGQLAAELN